MNVASIALKVNLVVILVLSLVTCVIVELGVRVMCQSLKEEVGPPKSGQPSLEQMIELVSTLPKGTLPNVAPNGRVWHSSIAATPESIQALDFLTKAMQDVGLKPVLQPAGHVSKGDLMVWPNGLIVLVTKDLFSYDIYLHAKRLAFTSL